MEPSSTGDNQNEDMIGRSIGDYELVRRLGRGGMANVYLAEHKSLRRKVALKILRPDLSVDESYVKRFLREAQAAAGLVQANIVQIYEIGEVDGVHFIAQEYVRGQNLRQYMSRFGAVDSLMAVNVLRQTAMALQKAADASVIHRDIKPENIMLSTNGEIKVTDFGLARVNDQPSQLNLTQIGITMGTPLYMSPEQVEGKAIDPRSDIYSLGITAYHMLSGDPPFHGENALAIAVKHVKNDPRPLQQVRPDIPVALANLIHKMIAKRPEDRIQTAGELLKEVRKIHVDPEDDWQALAERLASDEFKTATVDSRFAETQQLQTVMMGNVRSWWRRPVIITTMLISAVMGVAGGVAATVWNPPPDLLDIRVSKDKVSRKENIKEQYRTAQWQMLNAIHGGEDQQALLDSSRYFHAVIDYFPESESESVNTVKHYHLLARQQLGEIYWRAAYFEKANDQFEILKNVPDLYIRVTGMAGHALYLKLLNDEEGVLEILAELENDEARYWLSEYFQEQVQELVDSYKVDKPPI